MVGRNDRVPAPLSQAFGQELHRLPLPINRELVSHLVEYKKQPVDTSNSTGKARSCVAVHLSKFHCSSCRPRWPP